MAEIVNLRIVRKQRARSAARSLGTEEAVRSGESRADAGRRHAKAERERRRLEGHRVERPEDGGPEAE